MFENRDKPEWPVRKIPWESTYYILLSLWVKSGEPGTKGWEVLLSIIIIVLLNVCYL